MSAYETQCGTEPSPHRQSQILEREDGDRDLDGREHGSGGGGGAVLYGRRRASSETAAATFKRGGVRRWRRTWKSGATGLNGERRSWLQHGRGETL
jgi:hypothetical protein